MEVLACPHPLDSFSLPASRQGQEERSHAEFHPGQIAAVRQRSPSSSHGRHGQHVFVPCLFFEVRRTPLGRRWGSSSSTAVLPYIVCGVAPVRLDRVSNDGYKSCRGLRIYSQALLWNSTSCRRRVRALRSLSALSPISPSLCPLMQRP